MAILPGDLVPNITMPGPNGRRVELANRPRAGFVQVICLSTDETAIAMTRALVAFRPGFEACHAVVSVSAPPDVWMSAPIADWPIAMIENDLQLADALGAAPPCIWIVDPCKRLAQIIPWHDDAVQDALATVKRLVARTPDQIVELPAPVLVIPQVFEPEFCRQLIDYWETGEKQGDMVSTADMRGGGQIRAASLKRRLDTPIVDVELTRQIADRLQRRVGPMIDKAFKTVANHFETFRIGCYDAADQGHFGRHWDDTAPKTAHRKMAMSVNLNAGDYEGGELVFPEFGRQRYAPPTGAAVIFSCSMLHEALPVNTGRRFGLFGFFFDDQGAAQVRQLIEAEGGQIQEAAPA